MELCSRGGLLGIDLQPEGYPKSTKFIPISSYCRSMAIAV